MFALKYIQPRIKRLSHGLFANWLPTNPVDVGDFGVVRRGCFQRHGSLREYGFRLESEIVPDSDNHIDYRDRMDLSIEGEATANAGPDVQGRVAISAKARGAFIYHLSNLQHKRPKNSRVFNEELANAVVKCGQNFPDDGVVITEVVSPEHSTIIVSDAKEGSLALSTDFAPVGQAFLSGASGNISTGRSLGTFFSFIGEKGTTALIKIVIPKIIPPSPPGGGTSGALARTAEALKDWLRQKRVGTEQLKLYPSAESPDAAQFWLSDGSEEDRLLLDLVPMSEEEMIATISDDDVEEADIDFDIGIDEQELRSGKKSASG